MRKLVLSMFMSLDGYVEGPNKELIGPAYSQDLQRRWIDRNMDRAGLMLYGRVAYEGMAQFWTSPNAPKAEAEKLAGFDKLVFSRTLKTANWGNVTIIRDNIADEINRRKAQPGRDMVLIAGGNIAQTFLRLGLIDEINLLIMPILFGGGTRLFDADTGKVPLTLVESVTLEGGLIHAVYRR